MKESKPGKLEKILQELSQLTMTKAVSGKGHTNPPSFSSGLSSITKS